MNRNDTRADTHDDLDVRIDDVLRYVLAIGAVLVLLVPAARGFSDTLGWLPLWLLAMPSAALWALHRLPHRGDDARPSMPRRARVGPQARRRVRGSLRRAVPRAA